MRWRLGFCAVALACGACKQTELPQSSEAPKPGEAPKPAAPAADADPVVAEVDLDKLRWSQLDARLRELKGQESFEIRAMALAASDVLVVREMQVVHQAPAPTETAAQAADRFLASVWNANRGCNLTDDEIRLAYLQNLARFKHPPGFTVWQAQTRCCEGGDCPLDVREPCLAAQRPALTAFADAVRQEFAALPPLGLAAEASEVKLSDSPLKARHLPLFEQKVSELQAAGAKVQLLRYTFWQAGVAGFEKAPFRRTDPAVEAAAQKAKIGEVLGPLDGDQELVVAVVAARQPLALGLPKGASPVLDEQAVAAQREIRQDLCEQAAVRERQTYRERLLGGAQIRWMDAALQGRVSAEALAKFKALGAQK